MSVQFKNVKRLKVRKNAEEKPLNKKYHFYFHSNNYIHARTPLIGPSGKSLKIDITSQNRLNVTKKSRKF